MHPRRVGWVCMVVGGADVLIFGLADPLGISRNPGRFGEIQWMGISAGAILFILGFAVFLWSNPPRA